MSIVRRLLVEIASSRRKTMTDDEIRNKLETISKKMEEIVQDLKGDMPNKGVLTKNEFLLHEYDALRAEIVQRTSVRFTIITLTMTVFGAVFALSSPSIGPYLQMLYPVLSLFLMASYIANSYGIRKIEKFIKDGIENNVRERDQEPCISSIGWHHHNQFAVSICFLKLSLSYLLSNLLFPFSSLIAWGVSWISISDPKFTTISREGINITYFTFWSSLVIILITIFFAFFEGRIFDVEKEK